MSWLISNKYILIKWALRSQFKIQTYIYFWVFFFLKRRILSSKILNTKYSKTTSSSLKSKFSQSLEIKACINCCPRQPYIMIISSMHFFSFFFFFLTKGKCVCVFSFLKQAARIPFFFCLWLVDGLSEENHYGLPH